MLAAERRRADVVQEAEVGVGRDGGEVEGRCGQVYREHKRALCGAAVREAQDVRGRKGYSLTLHRRTKEYTISYMTMITKTWVAQQAMYAAVPNAQARPEPATPDAAGFG